MVSGMSFKDQMKVDFVACVLNTDECAEDITYTPKGATAKPIKAIVERKGISPAGENSGRILIDQVEIIIANDAVYGVASINKGGDTVSLPDRIGGTITTYRVAHILAQDVASWHLLLER
jgi:hypothetical protein